MGTVRDIKNRMTIQELRDYTSRFNIGDEVFIPKDVAPEQMRSGRALVYSVHKNHIVFKLKENGIRVSFTRMECSNITIESNALPVQGEYSNLDEYFRLLDAQSK